MCRADEARYDFARGRSSECAGDDFKLGRAPLATVILA